MQRRTVNDRQLDVLSWIADGCPDGVMLDFSHKTTAAALRNRGLAAVSKRGGWHAEITNAGRHYLEHGGYPDDAKPAQPESRPQPRPRKVRTVTEKPTPAPTPKKSTPRAPTPVEVTPLRAVPVPQRLVQPHPVVAALQERKVPITTKSVHSRALRILHAIAVAAEREGWTAQSVAQSRNYWGGEWPTEDHLVINNGECCVGIRVTQQSDKTAHTPTKYETDQLERWGYPRIPPYDHTPSDRLSISLESRLTCGRNTFADRQRWALEDKLPELMDEIARRGDAEREWRLKREAEEAERQRIRDVAIEKAKIQLRKGHRAKSLLREAEDWTTANTLRLYLDAMESRIGSLAEAEAPDARAWLDWCRAYAEGVDPLGRTIAIPTDPEPTDEALRPFLDRWSR